MSLMASQFFMLILFIFLAELAAAILAFLFREHVSSVPGSVHLVNPSVRRPKAQDVTDINPQLWLKVKYSPHSFRCMLRHERVYCVIAGRRT